jgi:Putative phage integrase
VALLVKLILPLRAFQVCRIDPGEADIRHLDELSKSVGKNVVRAALHFANICTSNSVGEELRKRYPVPTVTHDSRSRLIN